MTTNWKQQPVPAPLIDGVSAIASGIGGVTQSLEGVLTTLLSALNVARAFFTTTTDPLSALFQSLLTEIENLVNDLFNAGIYHLIVNPQELGEGLNESVEFQLTGDIAQDPDIETLKLIVRGKASSQSFDNFGIKLLTPSDCVDYMVRSFDDLGDTKRPVFSSSGIVSAVGFIVTAPTLDGFLPLLKPLGEVLGLQAFLDIYNKMNEKKTPAAELPEPKSQLPDWNDSLSLATFELMRNQRDLLLSALATVKGYTQNADEPIKDLIDVLEKKVTSLQSLVKRFNDLIAQLEAATKASGVYVFNYPPTIGGVTALKTALQVNEFSSLTQNKYTAGILIVGGGPSLAAVDAFRLLVAG